MLLNADARYAEAIPEWQQALNVAYTLDLNPAIQTAYYGLSEAYRYTRNPDKALEYLERAYAMERHLLDEQRIRSLDELDVRFRTAEKEKQLALAENENLLKARQLARFRWYLTLLGGSLLLALSLGFLWRQQRQMARLRAERERLEHRQTVEKLQAEKEFSALQALFAGQEQERRRIASELHDSLGGLLYALRLQLSKTELALPALDKSRQLLETAASENRRISQALLPPALARIGLVAALREWAPQFEQNFGLSVALDLPETELSLPDETAVSLFRIAQELMTNAGKHAEGATRVSVQLTAGAGALQLRVADDGRGFEPGSLPDTAFKTVRSRVKLIGGQLEIASGVGRGTVVEVSQHVQRFPPG